MKRVLSLVLAVALLCAMLPYTAQPVAAIPETMPENPASEKTEAESRTEVEPVWGNPVIEYPDNMASSYDSGKCGDNLTWVLSGGTLTISGSGPMAEDCTWGASYLLPDIKKVVIRSGVTSICDYAFYGCFNMLSISIPSSVTEIGDGAFYYCNALQSITIPSGVTTIGNSAFRYCIELQSISMGSNVTSIGYEAFYYCESLQKISIPSSVTYIGGNAFYGCSSLSSVYVTNIAAWCKIQFASQTANPLTCAENLYLNSSKVTALTVPQSATVISDYAFYNYKGLQSVTTGNGVTSIGSYAFAGCENLQRITVGTNVASVGEKAFDKCYSLSAVYITDLAAWCAIDFEELLMTYAEELYLNNEEVTELVIPDGVTAIGNSAFCGMDYLKSVVIPDSVTTIGKAAFSQCYALKSVSLGNGVTQIGNSAFFATGISDITIPDSVTVIGDSAFQGSKLQSISFGNGVTTIGERAFRSCSSLHSITIPDSVTAIGEGAFEYCDNLQSAVLGNGVTTAQSGLFSGCVNLSSVTFGSSVAVFEEYAFLNCNSLTGIWVAEDNPHYSNDDRGVLFSKDGTELVMAPVGLTGSYKVPDGVITIRDSAFEYCGNLKSVTVSDSVTAIGSYAFYECDSMKSIRLPDGLTSIGHRAFLGCVCLQSVTIPDSVTSIGTYAFGFCDRLQSVVLGKGITTISESVFCECESLQSITIADSVTEIERDAFRYCTSLTDVYYRGTAQRWAAVKITNYDTSNAPLIKATVHTLESGIYVTPPTKTGYQPTEELDLSGMCVELVSDEGTHILTEGYTVTGYDPNVPGEQTVTVSYEGFTATFTAYVYDISWNFAGDTLTISGSGKMQEYTASTQPWKAHRSKIKKVVVEDGITTIGAYALYYCKNLTEVYLPSSVISVSQSAFQSATGLTDVAYDGTRADWETITVGTKNDSFVNANIHCVDPSWAANSCGENLTWKLENGVLTISGTGAMRSYHFVKTPWKNVCTEIKAVVLETGVTGISDYAFKDCENLQSVTIPESVTSIGAFAFADCKNLTDVHYAASAARWAQVSVGGNNTCLADAKIHTVEPTLTDMVFAPPAKTEYWTGEELDTAGMVITVSYSDGSTAVITEGYEITGFDTNVAGEQTVTVTYESKTASFMVNVKPLGDVNGDGVVDTLDRTVLTRYLAGWDGYEIDAEAADVNQDGSVDTRDRAILTRYLADWEGYKVLPYAG